MAALGRVPPVQEEEEEGLLSDRRLRRSGMKPLLTVLTGIAPGRCLDRELVDCSLAMWSRY